MGGWAGQNGSGEAWRVRGGWAAAAAAPAHGVPGGWVGGWGRVDRMSCKLAAVAARWGAHPPTALPPHQRQCFNHTLSKIKDDPRVTVRLGERAPRTCRSAPPAWPPVGMPARAAAPPPCGCGSRGMHHAAAGRVPRQARRCADAPLSAPAARALLRCQPRPTLPPSMPDCPLQAPPPRQLLLLLLPPAHALRRCPPLPDCPLQAPPSPPTARRARTARRGSASRTGLPAAGRGQGVRGEGGASGGVVRAPQTSTCRAALPRGTTTDSAGQTALPAPQGVQ